MTSIIQLVDPAAVRQARSILDSMSRDELLGFGEGHRLAVLKELECALQVGDIGPWFGHLQKTSRFISDQGAIYEKGATFRSER